MGKIAPFITNQTKKTGPVNREFLSVHNFKHNNHDTRMLAFDSGKESKNMKPFCCSNYSYLNESTGFFRAVFKTWIPTATTAINCALNAAEATLSRLK